MRGEFKIGSFFRFVFIWVLIESIWWIKSPELFRSFYGEDARIFGTQALSSNFPSDLLIKHSGYMHLLPRVLVRFSLLFPLGIAPLLLTTLVAGVIAFLCGAVFNRLNAMFENKILLAAVALSFAFLPISNFESLGNAANLHFFLTAAAALMLCTKARGKSDNFQGFLICLFAATSDPFLFVFALLALLSVKDKNSKSFKVGFSHHGAFYGWVIGVTVQIFFMVFAPGPGRLTDNLQPITKVLYLFLDRVVGSALIPNWGFISGDQIGQGPNILLRALIGLALMIFIMFLILHNVKQNRISSKKILVGAISVGFYWTLAGILINPEPRYAVAPGILLLFTIAINLDRFRFSNRPMFKTKQIPNLFILLLITTWLTSLSPSKQLAVTVNWGAQVESITSQCQVENVRTVELVARPLIVPEGEKNQTLIFPCKDSQ